ncbi:CHAT domain-containing protein [Candidatus Parabeggiatoa sp. HSG14]|uniref:CHAT domain-containing protein n=1 Tax=Candidatus Parabeggiatoa sp. HSG14 TaxID=3055593 RepID=UPI0025A8EEE0|nr:CHAT domain-containing protein [Thiotrichales bacterium HSG14]
MSTEKIDFEKLWADFSDAETPEKQGKIFSNNPELFSIDGISAGIQYLTELMSDDDLHNDIFKQLNKDEREALNYFRRILPSLQKNPQLMTAGIPVNSIPSQFRSDIISAINPLGYYYAGIRKEESLKDLEKAIAIWEQILNHPEFLIADEKFRCWVLWVTGSIYQIRFNTTGILNDLDHALLLWKATIKQVHNHPSDLPRYLGALGAGLIRRYEVSENFSDLENGIEHLQKAASILPEHSLEKSRILNNLGAAVSARYRETQNVSDLENSIDIWQKLVELTPESWPTFPTRLANLGESLLQHYDITKKPESLGQSISYLQKSTELIPDKSSEKPRLLWILAISLKHRYSLTKKVSDLQGSLNAFKKSAQMGLQYDLESALNSSCGWLDWIFDRQEWAGIAQPYDYLHKAGTRLLQNQSIRKHQESWLRKMQGYAAQAGYAFAQENRLKKAVVALERGSAQLLSLALRHVENYIDSLGKYEFEFDEIVAATQSTLLIYIVTTRRGGKALIVNEKGKVNQVELADLTAVDLGYTLDGLAEPPSGYLGAYFDWRENPKDTTACTQWFNALEETTAWLWEVVMEPLIQIIPKKTKVTLIPIGLLGLLPLHAAWTEDNNTPTGKRYALDELTISYAPNARSLTEARKVAHRVTADRMLAVDEPKPVTNDKGEALPLPSSEYEVQTVVANFAQPQIFKHEAATRQAILDALANCTVLHFSCHGSANLEKPLESALIMANNESLTVKDFLDLRLNGVRLATLSACETGIPGIELPDEVVNLPAGLLQAGVAGVVASLWSVSDMSTALLMTKFYQNVTTLWQEQGTQASIAPALQKAQCWLRDATKQELQEWANQLSLSPAQRMQFMVLFNTMPERPFSSPFYWAAFCAIGQ